MKKIFSILAVLCLVFGVTATAMAAFQVEVKTNSEPVTGAPGACEKAGNITFIFDQGTIFQDGDWFTADLPIGVTICHSFDFVILGTNGLAVPGGGGGFATTAAPGDTGTTLDNDLWAVKDTVAGDGVTGQITAAGVAQIFFRVRGNVGASRIRIDVYDEEGANISDPLSYNGNSSLAVDAGTEFQIKLFDSEPHDGTGTSGGVWAFNDTPIAPAAADGIYGNAVPPADFLQNFNDWDNTYCIAVDADVYGAATVNVSINSGGVSGSNFLTFNPSNPQVAHLALATAITLEACKGDINGLVPFSGGQAATCTFEYNNGTSYCTFLGNEFILQNNSGTFWDPLDQYRMVLRISGNGAYFNATPVSILGFLPTQDPCTAAGTAIAPAWTITTETAVAPGGGANGVGCGAIDPDDRFVTLTSAAFTGIDAFNALTVDIPTVVYDPARFVAGDRVTVSVELWRLPCGMVFSGDRVVAEFVETCPVGAPTSVLYYPYAVALDGSQGWWFGMTIGNPTASAGDAVITVVEADGDQGTVTRPINAFGLDVIAASTLLSGLTQTAGSGTLGDSPCHILVNCGFGNAGGFGMTGNGIDSTGYTAYTDANIWNN